MGPTRVLLNDSCLLDLPEILTVAHIESRTNLLKDSDCTAERACSFRGSAPWQDTDAEPCAKAVRNGKGYCRGLNM